MKNILCLMCFLTAWQFQGQTTTINNQITDSRDREVLWGELNQEGLSQAPFNSWFTNGFTKYEPDLAITEQLKLALRSYSITVFMGTWCGDSKREVPRLIKILEMANFDMNKLTIIGVRGDAPYYKMGPNKEEFGMAIHRVPTIILYQNGSEVNRIVESAVATLEQDLLNITQGNYQANYPVVQATAKILKQDGVHGLSNSKIKKLAATWKPQVESLYELNTYARTLLAAKQNQEAIAVLKLNIALFPEDHRTYYSLANKLETLEEDKQAIGYYKKALKLDPENQDYLAALDRLKSQN